MKLFVFLSDVTEDGAHTYVPHTQYLVGPPNASSAFAQGMADQAIPEAELLAYLNPGWKQQKLFGKAGLIWLEDTHVFHKADQIQNGSRALFQVDYMGSGYCAKDHKQIYPVLNRVPSEVASAAHQHQSARLFQRMRLGYYDQPQIQPASSMQCAVPLEARFGVLLYNGHGWPTKYNSNRQRRSPPDDTDTFLGRPSSLTTSTHAAWAMYVRGQKWIHGAFVMAHSLRVRLKTPHAVVLMVEQDSSVYLPRYQQAFKALRVRIRLVNASITMLAGGQMATKLVRSRFAYSLGKLQAFRLVEYRRVVLIDPDMYLSTGLDALFAIRLRPMQLLLVGADSGALTGAESCADVHQFSDGMISMHPEINGNLISPGFTLPISAFNPDNRLFHESRRHLLALLNNDRKAEGGTAKASDEQGQWRWRLDGDPLGLRNVDTKDRFKYSFNDQNLVASLIRTKIFLPPVVFDRPFVMNGRYLCNCPQANAMQLVGSGSMAIATFGGMTKPWDRRRPGHMVNAFGDLFSQADCIRSWLNDGMSCEEWLYCSWQADAAGAQIQHNVTALGSV